MSLNFVLLNRILFLLFNPENYPLSLTDAQIVLYVEMAARLVPPSSVPGHPSGHSPAGPTGEAAFPL